MIWIIMLIETGVTVVVKIIITAVGILRTILTEDLVVIIREITFNTSIFLAYIFILAIVRVVVMMNVKLLILKWNITFILIIIQHLWIFINVLVINSICISISFDISKSFLSVSVLFISSEVFAVVVVIVVVSIILLLSVALILILIGGVVLNDLLTQLLVTLFSFYVNFIFCVRFLTVSIIILRMHLIKNGMLLLGFIHWTYLFLFLFILIISNNIRGIVKSFVFKILI